MTGLRRLWAWPWELRRSGVLGLNRRNAEYLARCNPRRLYPRVDDKSLTKAICEQHGIPVPQTYAHIRSYGDLALLARILGDRQQFVVKPAHGAAGRGILVIERQDGVRFHAAGGETLSLDHLRYHLSGILSGLYSLAGQPDTILVERRVQIHPVFRDLAVGGTPDVRIIVYRGVPVLAMLRLPTLASRGRANLHQGAVGVGIRLAEGVTTGGVLHDRSVDRAPDTGAPIAGLAVPWWRDMLRIAARLSQAIEMAYLGIDLVLDNDSGPVVLEANARPGLAIQIANRCGLRQRLERVHAASPHALSLEQRLHLAISLAETPAGSPA